MLAGLAILAGGLLTAAVPAGSQQLYPVMIQTVGPGTVSQSPIEGSQPYGTTVTLTALPDSGCQFVAWSGSVSGASNPITLTVDGPKDVTATFAITGLDYVLSHFDAPYEPIAPESGAGTLMVAAHDSTRSIDLPFDFPYAGTVYPAGSFLAVSSNGHAYLSRESVTAAPAAQAANVNLFTSAAPNATLAPWYDDLAVAAVGSNPAGRIYYQNRGVAGSRTLTVQWTNVSSYFNVNAGQPRQINFQLVVYETGVIEFRYGPVIGTDFSALESASIAIEDSIGGNNHYLDAVTGSRLTSSGMMTSNKWPARHIRFTPARPSPVAGGAYRVGAGGDYANLSDAFAELNHRGISGPVTLSLVDAVYDTSATGGRNVFPLLLGPVAGADTVRTITLEGSNAVIRSRGTESGVCGNQTTTNAITAVAEPVLAIVGVDGVTIRDLTIEGGRAVDRGVLLINSSRADGAQHNVIRDVRVALDRANPSSIGIQQTAVVAPTTVDGTNSYNRYFGMTIENAYSGLSLNGSGAWFDTGCEVGGASGGAGRITIGAAKAADIGGGSAGVFGVRAVNQSDLVLTNVEVRNLSGTGSGNVDGIDVGPQGVLTPSQGVTEISNCDVHDLTGSSPSAGRVTGIRIAATSNPNSDLRVFDNVIRGLNSASTTTTSRRVAGILAQETSNGSRGTLDVDFNSVRLEPTGLACPNACLEIGAIGPVVHVRNNVLANFTAAQTGAARHYVIVTPATSSIGPAGSVSERNVLFVANPANGFTGRAASTDVASLEAWRSTTGADILSHAENPRFVSAADLHIDPAVETPVEGAGSMFGGAITWVGRDADSEVRDATAPDIGADEGTFIPLGGLDQPPVVTAPVNVNANEGQPLTIAVAAGDPNGDPIDSLTADLSGLPSGQPVFTTNASHTTGSLAWTPAPGAGRTAPYNVTFTAFNALSGWRTTSIRVNAPPVAALSLTPSSGTAPLTVTLDASASTDRDGSVVSYVFDFGDGSETVGPQSGASVTHTYAGGTFNATVYVTDDRGATTTTTRTLTVAAAAGNIVTNPGFETDLSGWKDNGSSLLTRVTPGHSGSWCVEVKAPSNSTFGITDYPNLIQDVSAAGITYHLSAWVRSASHHGAGKIKVREFLGSTQQGSSAYSNGYTLSTTWQQITFDYVTRVVGSYLDVEVNDYPIAPGEIFQIDDISITTDSGPTQHAPVVSAPASVSVSEGDPVTVTVTVSDADGDAITSLAANFANLPPGNNAVFTTNGAKTSGTLTWTPTTADGRTAPYDVTFTASNSLSGSATTSITVYDVAANLVTNPGFETDLSGWARNGSSILTRVTPGHTGSWCVEVKAPSNTTFGITDSPNLIQNVAAAGINYHLSAWVRSASNHGAGKIKVREFIGSTQQGSSAYSNGYTLSTTWQQITFDYVTRTAGSYLDIEVNDYPIASGEVFQIDDIVITKAGTAPALPPPRPEPQAGFAVRMTANPVRGSGELELVITQPGQVHVRVFDLAGRMVAEPLHAFVSAGRRTVPISPHPLGAGVYFYEVRATEGTRRSRFVVL